MPRLPDRNLGGCFFIYPTADEAHKGAPSGGSGFFVGFPWADSPGHFHLYAVTNRHVVCAEGDNKGTPTLRINTKGDQPFDVIETTISEWRWPESGDDIAVRRTIFAPQHEYTFDSLDRLVDGATIVEYGLGVGDEVFSIGRFLDEDGGIKRNRPVARFGLVSVMLEVPILVDKKGRYQDSDLVEMRSRTGFSGSPVYIFIPAAAPNFTDRKVKFFHQHGPWILGVHWGQMPVVGPDAREIGMSPTQSYGTGITGVVPAYRLKKFLSEDRTLAEERRHYERELASRPRPTQEAERPESS